MGICMYVFCALCNLHLGKIFFNPPSKKFYHPYLWIVFLELGKLYNHRNGYPDSSQNEDERVCAADKGRICRFRASELKTGRGELVCIHGHCGRVPDSTDTPGNFGPFPLASQSPQVHLSLGDPSKMCHLWRLYVSSSLVLKCSLCSANTSALLHPDFFIELLFPAALHSLQSPFPPPREINFVSQGTQDARIPILKCHRGDCIQSQNRCFLRPGGAQAVGGPRLLAHGPMASLLPV